MYIKLDTLQYPVSEIEIRASNPNTSFPQPFNPDGYAVVFATPQPAYDQYSQKCTEQAPELTDKGTWQQVWLITDMTGEELEVGRVRKATDEAKAEAVRVDALWQAAHDKEFQAISGSAIGMLSIGGSQAKPKCVAVQNWIMSFWTEYYTRKANGSTDTDYSMFGEMPYSVPELIAEVYGA